NRKWEIENREIENREKRTVNKQKKNAKSFTINSFMKTVSENRPKLKPIPTKIDLILEIVAFLFFLAIWFLPIAVYQNLPDIIPTHYNLKGEIDDWGSKNTIFILPAIGLILYIGITVLNKYPNIFNYPSKITEENALQQYSKATRWMRIIKLIIVVLFLAIEWKICITTVSSKLPVWFLPVVIVIPILLPIVLAFSLTKKPSQTKNKD
ncbi:MAG: DUF1648 domain-containing protein, partial [Bacteroidales bacterium]